jgi:hypothetical protein
MSAPLAAKPANTWCPAAASTPRAVIAEARISPGNFPPMPPLPELQKAVCRDSGTPPAADHRPATAPAPARGAAAGKIDFFAISLMLRASKTNF